MIYFLIFSLFSTASELATSEKPNVYDRQKIQHGRCPEVLENLRKEDKKDRYTFLGKLKNQDKSCHLNLTKKDHISSPYDLYLELQKKYPLSNSTKRTVLSCMRGDEEEARNKVAKYYYYNERLALANLEKIEQIAAIDSILPNQKSMDKVRCPNASSPKARIRCNELRKCSTDDKNTFESLAEKAMEANEVISKYNQLKKDSEVAKSMLLVRSTKERQDKYNKAKKALEKLKPLYEQLKLANPWVNGKVFQDSIEDYINNVEIKQSKYLPGKEKRKLRLLGIKKALKAQLKHTRSLLNQDLKEYREVSECLLGARATSDCETKKIRKIIHQTPGLDITYSADKKKNSVAQYLNTQRCLIDAKVDQDEVYKTMSDSAWAAGLTIATGGVALAGAAKLATNAAAKSLGFSKNTKTISEMYRAQKMGRVVLAERATLAADTAYLIPSSEYVIEACAKEKNEMEKVLKLAVNNKKQCPSFKNNGGEVISDYNTCLAAIAGASLDVLPIAAWAAGPVGRALQKNKTKGKTVSNKKIQIKSKNIEVNADVNDLVKESEKIWMQFNKYSKVIEEKEDTLNKIKNASSGKLRARNQAEVTELKKSLAKIDKKIDTKKVDQLIKDNNKLMLKIAKNLQENGFKVKLEDGKSVLSDMPYAKIKIIGAEGENLSTKLEKIKKTFGLKSEIDIYENAKIGSAGFVTQGKDGHLLSLKPGAFINKNLDDVNTIHIHEIIHGQENSLSIRAKQKFTEKLEIETKKIYDDVKKEIYALEKPVDKYVANDIFLKGQDRVEELENKFYSNRLKNLKKRAALNERLKGTGPFEERKKILNEIKKLKKEDHGVSTPLWNIGFHSEDGHKLANINGYKTYYRADEARTNHAQARMIINQYEKAKKGLLKRNLSTTDTLESAKRRIKKSRKFNAYTKEKINNVLNNMFTKKVKDNIEYTRSGDFIYANIPLFDRKGNIISKMSVKLIESNSVVDKEYNFYELYNYLHDAKRNILNENRRLLKLLDRAEELE